MSDRPDTLAFCDGWLARYAELEVLSARCRIWEAELNLSHNWSMLSDQERRAVPYASGFLQLEAEIRALSEECESTRPLIAEMAARTPAALAAKLRVVLMELCPAENAEAHALLASAVRDAEAVAAAA